MLPTPMRWFTEGTLSLQRTYQVRLSGVATAIALAAGCTAEGSGDGATTMASTNPTSGDDDNDSTGGGGSTAADASSEGPATTAGSATDTGGLPTDKRPDPPCESAATMTLDGNRYVAGGDEAELQGVRRVVGNLTVQEGITSLDFLRCLEEVGGTLTITGTDIEDSAGLTSLTSVGGLALSANNSLPWIYGFPALTEIGDLVISSNAALIQIDGPPALTTLGVDSETGNLVVQYNDKLESINGFEKITAILGDIQIRLNEGLTSIEGLHKLKALGGKLVISNNPQLCISQVSAVGEDLEQWIMMGEGDTSGNNGGC